MPAALHRPLPWLLPLALLLAALCSAHAWEADRMRRAAERLGPRAVAALPALEALLDYAAEAQPDVRLAAVNDFYNKRIAFAEDLDVWGEVDHWASPLELLAQGRGDCEDYAIAKYFTLVAAGTPPAQLRLVYVRATLPGGRVQAHMVLAYYASADASPLILDNLVAKLEPASRRPDLVPVFSFNSEGLWEGTGATSAGDPLARLSRWRQVLAQARAEGFV